MLIIKNITDWNLYRQETFTQIGKILEENKWKSISYTIVGRNYLDNRLIIHFDDCHQVFDFFFHEKENQLEITKFFTKDITHEDKIKHLEEFKELTTKWDLIKEQ